MRLSLIHILLLVFSVASAQKVKIVGKADPVYFGKEISALIYSDYISEREMILDTDSVNKPGFFSLEFTLNTTSHLLLRVGNIQGVMYAEPGKTYKIGFVKKDSTQIVAIGNIVPIQLVFMDADSTDLNYLIQLVDTKINGILERHRGEVVKDQRPKDIKPDSLEIKKNQNNVLLKKLDTAEIRMSMLLRRQRNSNIYFKNYFLYSFALAKLPLIGSKRAWETYIAGKPVLYHHKEYMNFIHAFYETELEGKLYTSNMINAINENESFSEFKNGIKHPVYTPNDSLTELATLIMLKTAYNIKNYKKPALCNTISRYAIELKPAWHKSIATNLYQSICRLVEGAEIADQKLLNRFGKTLSLNGYKDKFVFLMFWRSDIAVCEEQLRAIPELKKKYGHKIVFISVFIDENEKDAEKLLKKYPGVNWEIIYGAKNKTMAEYFRVKAVPLYYLVNPFNRLLLSPAPEPGLDLEKIFNEVTKKGYKPFVPGQKEN